MEKTFQFFIGVDISKNTLDFTVLDTAGVVLKRGQIANDESCWDNLTAHLEKFCNWTTSKDMPQTLFCAEFTGMYTYHVATWVANGASLWLVSGKAIKHSQGIVRGKDDRIDAWRIANFAKTKVDEARFWKPLGKTIEAVRLLLSLRDRLVKAKVELDTPVKELKNFTDPEHYALLLKLNEPGLKTLVSQIDEVNAKIKELIDQDDELKHIREHLETIPGIGTVVANTLIAKTGGFKCFENARKLACQAGCAPFRYRSGTSVRGRTAVSHHADKELKKLLHLAAMAAVKVKESTFQIYYNRKRAEGKPHMLVFNNIRNKLIQTVFAVVKNNIPFDKNFSHPLAKS